MLCGPLSESGTGRPGLELDHAAVALHLHEPLRDVLDDLLAVDVVHEHVERAVEATHDLVGVELVDGLAVGGRPSCAAGRAASGPRVERTGTRRVIVSVARSNATASSRPVFAIQSVPSISVTSWLSFRSTPRSVIAAVAEVEAEEVVARRSVDDAGVGAG